jgi:hypothetical protein
MATFPALTPAERNFEEGILPVRPYATMSGVVWKRIYGDRVFGHKLQMVFRHIQYSRYREIRQHYLGQNTTVDQFDLHPKCAEGCDDPELVELMLRPDLCLWVYTGPPRRQDVQGNVCTAAVDLVSELPYQ